MHKLLWDFEIHTDHLISAWRPDLVIIKKKKRICWIVLWDVLANHRGKLKIERKWKERWLLGPRELKKLWNMKVTVIPIVIGALGTVIKGLVCRLWNMRTGGNHPNYSIIEIAQNIEESPGDLRGLAVTQTPVRNHQLKLLWKTLKGVNDIKLNLF